MTRSIQAQSHCAAVTGHLVSLMALHYCPDLRDLLIVASACPKLRGELVIASAEKVPKRPRWYRRNEVLFEQKNCV